MKFADLLAKSRRKQKDWKPPARLLAIDPGETIGWSVFENGELTKEGQIRSKDSPAEEVLKLFRTTQPTQVVCEDYKIYAEKANVHIGKTLFTPRMIGMIELYCYMNGIPIDYQMAHQAKCWVTDDKLKSWGFYIAAHKHSRDSIRHGTYWLMFHGR